MENQEKISNKSSGMSKVVVGVMSAYMFLFGLCIVMPMLQSLPYLRLDFYSQGLGVFVLWILILLIYFSGAFSIVFVLPYGIYKKRKWVMAPLLIVSALNLYWMITDLNQGAPSISNNPSSLLASSIPLSFLGILIFVYLYKNRQHLNGQKYSDSPAILVSILSLIYLILQTGFTVLLFRQGW